MAVVRLQDQALALISKFGAVPDYGGIATTVRQYGTFATHCELRVYGTRFSQSGVGLYTSSMLANESANTFPNPLIRASQVLRSSLTASAASLSMALLHHVASVPELLLGEDVSHHKSFLESTLQWLEIYNRSTMGMTNISTNISPCARLGKSHNDTPVRQLDNELALRRHLTIDVCNGRSHRSRAAKGSICVTYHETNKRLCSETRPLAC